MQALLQRSAISVKALIRKGFELVFLNYYFRVVLNSSLTFNEVSTFQATTQSLLHFVEAMLSLPLSCVRSSYPINTSELNYPISQLRHFWANKVKLSGGGDGSAEFNLVGNRCHRPSCDH